MNRHICQFNKQSLLVFVFTLLLFGAGNLFGQDAEEPKKVIKPVRNTFESILLLNNQTVMVPYKGTFEWDIQHRFGVVNNGYDDFYGFFAPSNLRLGFNYVPIEKLQIGLGLTKERRLLDFNIKYALVKQGRSGGSPVSVTYLGNMAIDTRDKDQGNFKESIDRLSYFNQLMVARKISPSFSLQVAGNVSHFNMPLAFYDSEQTLTGRMHATHLSASILARYKITDALSFIINYDQPVTGHDVGDFEPEPNLAFGIEIVTSSHAFQIFAGNYQSIVPQLNQVKNQNRMGDGEFSIGFNMTRLWNF